MSGWKEQRNKRLVDLALFIAIFIALTSPVWIPIFIRDFN